MSLHFNPLSSFLTAAGKEGSYDFVALITALFEKLAQLLEEYVPVIETDYGE